MLQRQLQRWSLDNKDPGVAAVASRRRANPAANDATRTARWRVILNVTDQKSAEAIVVAPTRRDEGPNINRQGRAVANSNATLNPIGGACDRRCATQPALHEDLMQAVLAPANLQQAWRRVKSNRGAPGIDGLRIEDFPAYARAHWPAIRQTLADGRYQPQPVRRVSIPKPNGGERALGIPTVVDRVIQQAIAQVMTPIFDPEFSESSYGFRPKRAAHGALQQVKSDIQAGYRIAVDLDLAKFFDNVDHDILMARVARRISDKRLLALIGRYLRAGVLINDALQPSELGTLASRPPLAAVGQHPAR